MSPNEHRHEDVRSVYKTLTRTHQRRSHYLMAPTYVFAVSRSLREQSDVPETDRLPTTFTLPPFHPHPLFPPSLFFSSFLFFSFFFYSTLCAPSFHCQKKDSSFHLFFPTRRILRKRISRFGNINLLSKFLCSPFEIFQPSDYGQRETKSSIQSCQRIAIFRSLRSVLLFL